MAIAPVSPFALPREATSGLSVTIDQPTQWMDVPNGGSVLVAGFGSHPRARMTARIRSPLAQFEGQLLYPNLFPWDWRFLFRHLPNHIPLELLVEARMGEALAMDMRHFRCRPVKVKESSSGDATIKASNSCAVSIQATSPSLDTPLPASSTLEVYGSMAIPPGVTTSCEVWDETASSPGTQLALDIDPVTVFLYDWGFIITGFDCDGAATNLNLRVKVFGFDANGDPCGSDSKAFELRCP